MTAGKLTDSNDIQALLGSGFGSLPEAVFLLLRIEDPAAARRWLCEAPVTSIADLSVYQPVALQLALSANGLRRLGLPGDLISAFAPEFVSGMAGDEGRSRRLGDVGDNAPANWRWGGAGEPDALVLLYAAAGRLPDWQTETTAAVLRNGLTVVGELHTTDMAGREPFGFVDGVSQPSIDWAGTRQPGSADDQDYSNLISPGEFLLGYRNEYGFYTERPLLDAAGRDLPAAEDRPGMRDLGRNGSYLVLRELHQDVRGFWRFMAAHAQTQDAEALAETMVGRRRSGEPMITERHAPIRGVGPDPADDARNRFTYDADGAGVQCPFGAHIRRANPRTGDLPGGRQGALSRLLRTLGVPRADLDTDLVASSRFHRVLRRGREFGQWIEPHAAMQPDCADPHSGLQFICLNASISRQFEFVQNAWLASPKFDGLFDETDPLTGNRMAESAGESNDSFSIPQPNGVTRRVGSVPRFVTVHGGGYFFLPGIRALRYLAAQVSGI